MVAEDPFTADLTEGIVSAQRGVSSPACFHRAQSAGSVFSDGLVVFGSKP